MQAYVLEEHEVAKKFHHPTPTPQMLIERLNAPLCRKLRALGSFAAMSVAVLCGLLMLASMTEAAHRNVSDACGVPDPGAAFGTDCQVVIARKDE